jgi:hypothetical protein
MKDTVGGRWRRAAAMKSGALKISKLRLVVSWSAPPLELVGVEELVLVLPPQLAEDQLLQLGDPVAPVTRTQSPR